MEIFPDGRMTPKAAAAYLGYRPGTLANWRTKGEGPRFIKCKTKIFYHQTDVEEWRKSESGICVSTAQARLTSNNGNDNSDAKV